MNEGKMYKMYFVLMALLFSFTFNACSSDSPEEDLPEKEEPGQPVEPDEPQDGDVVVLNENTILLSDGLDMYVDNPVQGSTLSLNSKVKASELPAVGRVLLYGGISDKFPSGFLGKVKQVVKTQEGYEIQTEPASLEETFDKLCINEPIELVFEDTDSSESRSIMPYWDKDGYVGLQTNWAVDFGVAFEKDWVSNATQSGSLSGHMECGVGIGVKLKCVIDIDSKAQKEPYIEFSFYYKNFHGINFDVKGALGCEYKKELKKFPIKPTLLPSGVAGKVTQIVLRPEFILSAFMNFEGEFGYHSEQHSQQEWRISFIYEHGIPRFERQNIKEEGDLSIKSLQLDGTISAGLSLDFSMKLFNNENISCELGTSAGPSITADISYEKEDLNNLYNKLKDSKITQTACNVAAQISVETPLFIEGTKIEGEYEVLSFSIGEKDYYLFPEFKPIGATWNDSKITASYHVSRDVFFPIELGVRLLDERKKKVEDSEEKIEYRLSGSAPVELTTNFKNASKGKGYYVCPIIKLPIFDNIITALPEQEVKGVTIMTRDASVQNTNAICWGELKGIDNFSEVEYGIKINEDYIVSHTINNSIYSVELSNLSEGAYNYCAYVKIGTEIYYGDIKTFTIEKKQYLSLEEFYNSTNGDNWINNKGWLKEADLLDWYGIEDELGFVRLSLEANNLSGDAILRNCDYVTSLFLGDNPISSLTLENWANSSHIGLQVGLPGNGEDINMVSCKGNTSLYVKNGKLGNLNVSSLHGNFTIQRDISGLDERNVEIDCMNYSNSYDSEWSYNIIHGVNAIVDEINISDCPGISVYIPKIKKINIKNISRPSGYDVSGIDIGVYDYRGDGYTETVHVDQCGKPLGSLSFRHKVNVLNITNVDGFSERYDYSLNLIFEKGVKEINVSNVSVKHFSAWTPNVTPINISNCKMYISAGSIYNGVNTADNIYHIKDCIIIYDAWDMEKSIYISSFTGTERQLSDYVWSLQE